MSEKLRQFTSDKERIDMLETSFREITDLASSMDEKILELKSAGDDLQILQNEVHRFQQTLGEISVRYERLEKKNTILDQTIEGVERTSEDLRKLETRLNDCSHQTIDMPDTIDVLRGDLNTLAEKSEHIGMLVDKLGNLDSVLAEADRHIEKVDKACEWISKTETRLDEMKKEAMEQVNLLGALIKGENKPKKKTDGAPPTGRKTCATRMEGGANRFQFGLDARRSGIDFGLLRQGNGLKIGIIRGKAAHSFVAGGFQKVFVAQRVGYAERKISRLLNARGFTRAAQAQIFFGNKKAVSRFAHNFKPLFSRFAQMGTVYQKAKGLRTAAPDTAA